MTEVGSRKQRAERTEMSEKAKGKWKVTETDDEGAENEEKTDGGRKRRRVTVKDPEETDWVRRVTEFMGRILMWKAERMRRKCWKRTRTRMGQKGTEKDRIVGKNVIEGWRTDGNRRGRTGTDGECSRTKSM